VEFGNLAGRGFFVLVNVNGRFGAGLGARGQVVGGDPVALGLVGVERAGEFAVGGIDVGLRGRRLDPQP
jgi:hypothetical protein